jgi:hypothetical protein
VVATPLDAAGEWEGAGNNRRIVTYTTLQIKQALDGRAPPSTQVTVRTLGGEVGDIGQRVVGEAQPAIGQAAVFFLSNGGRNSAPFRLAKMAAGYYPIVADERGQLRLRAVPQALEIGRHSPQSIARLLHGRALVECEQLIATAVAP